MSGLITRFQGQGLMARILRSMSWVIVGHGAGQALRLASNLILARLLFPEAFGLMALITMVMIGLSLFSDVGISPAISQSKRGDDQDFLDTAWTIQVIRGAALTVIMVLLSPVLAGFYDEPLLAIYMPIASVTLLISAFNPTRIETANRHLLLGRVTALDLLSQAIGIITMIVLAAFTQSVLSLVIGGILQAMSKLLLTHFWLPGARNRFRLEKSALGELITFGKWIFLSTAFYFLNSQGDKAILGKFLSLSSLGIYNIGFFLASFPLALGQTLAHRLLIPIYRERPPWESAENAAKTGRLRHALSAFMLVSLSGMALAGPWLVGILYDDRYILAGGIIVLIALAKMIEAVGMNYDRVALAAGNSRGFFVSSALRAVLQVAFLYIGIVYFGLVGALIGQALAFGLSHPALIWLARKHRAWDAKHDLIWFTFSAIVGYAALRLNADAIAALSGL